MLNLVGSDLDKATAQARNDFCDTVPAVHEEELYAAYADGRKDEREDILKALKALIAGLL